MASRLTQRRLQVNIRIDSPTVVVATPLWLGHIPAYHRIVCEGFERIGCHVIQLTPTFIDNATWYQFGLDPGEQDRQAKQAVGKIIRTRIRQSIEPTGVPAMRRAARTWHALARTINGIDQQVDLVFLTYLAGSFLAPWIKKSWIAEILTIPWSGIWNSPPLHGARELVFRRSHTILDASNCVGVLVPASHLAQRLASVLHDQSVFTMPEVADLRASNCNVPEIAELRKLAAGRKIVSVLGNLHRGKGLFTFLEAARKAWEAGEPLVFVAAGDLSLVSCGDDYEDISNATKNAPPNFLLVGRGLQDGEEFNAFVQSSDILFCAYWDFPFNSNILTKAAYFQKPVVVSKGGLMERLVIDYNLGRVVPQKDASAALEAIRDILGQSSESSEARPRRYEEFTRANSADKLDEIFRSILARVRATKFP